MSKNYYGKTTSTSWPIIMEVTTFHRLMNIGAAALFILFDLLSIKDGFYPGAIFFTFLSIYGIYKSINDFKQQVIIDQNNQITLIRFLQQPVIIQENEIKELIIKNEYTVDIFYLYSDTRLLLKVNSTWTNIERFISWCKKNRIGKGSF